MKHGPIGCLPVSEIGLGLQGLTPLLGAWGLTPPDSEPEAVCRARQGARAE